MASIPRQRYSFSINLLKKVVLFFFLFFFIYMPYLLGSYNPLHILAYLSWLSLVAFVFFSKKKRIIVLKFVQRLYPLVFLLFFICIYLAIVVVVNNNTAELIEIMYRFIVVLIEIIPISLFLSISFVGLNFGFEDLLNALIAIAIVQSFFSFAMLVSPSVRLAIFGIMARNGLDLNQFGFLEYRAFGITNNYTFSMPVFQSVIALFAFYRGVKGSPKHYLASGIILLSGIMNARISLFLFLYGSAVILVFFLRAKIKKMLKVAFSLITIILIVWLSLQFLAIVLPITSMWLEKSIEEARLFFFEGSREGYFFALEKMIHFPSGVQLVFGVGDSPFGGGMYGLVPNSDVGYVIDTYIGGVLLVMILGIFVFLLFKNARKYCRESGIYVLIFLLVILLANIKGYSFGPREFFNAYILLCVFAISHQANTRLRLLQNKMRL